jgi:hypothetical protein
MEWHAEENGDYPMVESIPWMGGMVAVREMERRGLHLLVIDGSGTMHFSDSARELVEMDIDGYETIPDTDEGHDRALEVRYDHLIELAERSQRWMVDEAARRGVIDWDSVDEDALTALCAGRTTPFEGLPAVDGGRDLDWKLGVPLVLCTTDYEPYTKRETPTGRIVWVNPVTELTYLRSLANLGVIQFHVVVDEPTLPEFETATDR